MIGYCFFAPPIPLKGANTCHVLEKQKLEHRTNEQRNQN
jgi:hypothetical protein